MRRPGSGFSRLTASPIVLEQRVPLLRCGSTVWQIPFTGTMPVDGTCSIVFEVVAE